MTTFTPEYLDLDFNTIVSNLKDQLKADPIFRDFDYEGSNIAILIELVAYLGDLSTYYINKLAKNTYIDTADLYENVNRQSNLIGYRPSGYISSRATVTITIDSDAGLTAGDELYLPAWKTFETGLASADGDAIYYTTTTSYTETVPSTASYSFDVKTIQGDVWDSDTEGMSYKGEDLIDNAIILPLYSYGYDDNLDDDYPSVEVSVDDVVWTRVSDFYENLSGLTIDNNVYMMKFDKYKRYKAEFSDTRNVPSATATIRIRGIKSLGALGKVAANKIALLSSDVEYVTNNTTGSLIDNSYITVANANPSTGGSNYQDVEEVKNSATAMMHAQYRDVANVDYEAYLENRSDIVTANVWGEQEIAPSGDFREYNKVHISVIPTTWSTSTITASAASAGMADNDIAQSYSETWKDTLSDYLEPRRMLNAFELYEVPDLCWFTFHFGIKCKRTYVFTDVATDVKNKLQYYFGKYDLSNNIESSDRKFGETISFTEIISYIKDITETGYTLDVDSGSSTYGTFVEDTWSNVKGINNLIIRDCDIPAKTINEPNQIGSYPQYENVLSTFTGKDNISDNIELGLDQFPMISIDECSFTVED